MSLVSNNISKIHPNNIPKTDVPSNSLSLNIIKGSKFLTSLSSESNKSATLPFLPIEIYYSLGERHLRGLFSVEQ